jgi:dimethylargininase
MFRRLARVLVRRPRAKDLASWRSYGWLAEPDPVRAGREHDLFCEQLRELGSEVLFAEYPDDGNPDAIYVCDPAILSDAGMLLLRPGKEGRRTEPGVMARDLARLDIPTANAMTSPATAEGGDTLWLDQSTLLVGRSYRTNAAGIEGLRQSLPEVDVLDFDLPHQQGQGSVLHLMSLLSPLDRDLAVAFVPLMPVALMEILAERSIEVVAVPEEEWATMAPNVLAVAPRVALTLDGNVTTRRAMERAGVAVYEYVGEEISRKGEGGPTCLTRPILRT